MNRNPVPEIAVKAATGLPETKNITHFTFVKYLILFKFSGRVFKYIIPVLLCHAAFGVIEHAPDIVSALMRPDQQVNMIGHQNISPEFKIMLCTRYLQFGKE